MHDLIGKVAVITGGASGIGYALAECFGQQGCHIVLADIEEESLSESVARLRRSGVDARGQVTDVANYDSVLRLRDFVDAIFGPADLLFNNAGVSITGPTWKMSPDDWRWVWDVNVWGVVNGIRAFLPAMLDRGKPGHIINTGSLASFNGNGDHAPYCSSKAAVLGLSQSLFSEM
jgi:NAD(P)-dependent dehydrogenase (short-subunit alcohol dehydrogenase family)